MGKMSSSLLPRLTRCFRPSSRTCVQSSTKIQMLWQMKDWLMTLQVHGFHWALYGLMWPFIYSNSTYQQKHWILVVLVLNSVRKSYNDVKVRIGIKPFIKMIPYLMKCIGIWKEDSMQLKVILIYPFPTEKWVCFYHHFIVNHTITCWISYLIDWCFFFRCDYNIYVVKYTEYMIHDDIGFMSIKLDADRAWLDIASL